MELHEAFIVLCIIVAFAVYFGVRHAARPAPSHFEKLYEGLKKTSTEQETALAAKDQIIHTLESRLHELESSLPAKDRELQNLRALLSEKNAELLTLSSQLSDFEVIVSDLESDKKSLKAENRKLSFKLSEASPLNNPTPRKSASSRRSAQPEPLRSAPKPAPEKPARSDHFSFEQAQQLVNSWTISNPDTESRACDPANVSDPVPLPDSSGLFRFDSKNEPGVFYRTSLHACSCPSYVRTDDLQRRPCKHMIRLAIHLHYYEKARFYKNQKALNSLMASQIGPLPF